MAANVNNYISAANAAVSKNVQIRKALADSKVKYDDIGKASVNQAARNRANAATNNSNVAQSTMTAQTRVELQEIDAKNKKDIRGINKQARMTGMLAGGAAMLGIGAMQLNKEEETDPTLGILQQQIAKQAERIKQAENDLDRYTALGNELSKKNTSTNDTDTATDTSTSSNSSGSNGSNGGNNLSSSGGSTLTGPAKTVADAIAKYESGDWGYEAFNQGGAAGGTKVVGKSGSYKDTYGTPLTGMTLQQIFNKQNTKQQGMSMQEHLDSGGLHAVGRYQFIGSTLQDEVSKMGLDPSTTKFTPEIQDAIFKSHIKRVGNISPWVGPMQNYSQTERDQFNSMIQQF